MTTEPGAAAFVDADHFDGQSARARPVRLAVARGRLVLHGAEDTRDYALREVEWPERQQRAARVVHLPDGGSLQAHDAEAFDAFVRRAGVAEPWIVRAQQSWRATLTAALLLLAIAGAGYRWGLPWAADQATAMLPPAVAASIDTATLELVEARWLQPSRLPAQTQQRLRDALQAALDRAYPADERPRVALRFHAGAIGPNAFALPGGTVVLTDELVEKVGGDEAIVLGVLGHEAGHVRHRHGLRMLTRSALLGFATALAFGDFSTLLAGAPALLGQLAYSRDFEREADAEAVRLLRAAGHSPAVMVSFFERLRDDRGTPAAEGGLQIALASHPPDAERIAYFRAAAEQP